MAENVHFEFPKQMKVAELCRLGLENVEKRGRESVKKEKHTMPRAVVGRWLSLMEMEWMGNGSSTRDQKSTNTTCISNKFVLKSFYATVTRLISLNS